MQYTYFLQLKAREAFARRCFSAVVVLTLPVVGLLSICKMEKCVILLKAHNKAQDTWSINCIHNQKLHKVQNKALKKAQLSSY